jgi:uncharacterized protein YjeT (DUF2065 family)
MRTGRASVHDERGMALALALVLVLILTGIILTVAQITTSELENHRMSRSDDTLRYVAIAGLEHQLYLYKADINAAATGYVNYPVLPSETTGCGAYWYNVSSITCTLPCTGTTSRQWTIQSDGENWINGCATTLIQQRSIRALVTIYYSGTSPTGVTFQRWEEIYP